MVEPVDVLDVAPNVGINVGVDVGITVAAPVFLGVGTYEGSGDGRGVSSTNIVVVGVGVIGILSDILSDILCPIDIDIDMLTDLASSRVTPIKGSKFSSLLVVPPLNWAELPDEVCRCCVRFLIGGAAASLAAAPNRTRSN